MEMTNDVGTCVYNVFHVMHVQPVESFKDLEKKILLWNCFHQHDNPSLRWLVLIYKQYDLGCCVCIYDTDDGEVNRISEYDFFFRYPKVKWSSCEM